MSYKDYYLVLGVKRDATADDIKRAYRKLARKFHPDVSKEADAEARFKEVNEAYEVLGDDSKRKLYDQYGESWKAVSEGHAPHPGAEDIRHEFRGEGIDPGQFQDLGSLFEELFGGAADGAFGGPRPGGPRGGRARWREWPMAGPDFESTLELGLEEAYAGGERDITLSSPSSGATRSYKVKIPAGVRDGQRIRLTGQGGQGSGGAAAGDLYLRIQLRPHAHYRFEGKDLITPLPLAPWEAALGASVGVRTLDGSVRIKVPPGSSSGKRIRLKGKGYPVGRGRRSNLYAELQVVVPEALDARERELFEQLASASDFRPRAYEEDDR